MVPSVVYLYINILVLVFLICVCTFYWDLLFYVLSVIFPLPLVQDFSPPFIHKASLVAKFPWIMLLAETLHFSFESAL